MPITQEQEAEVKAAIWAKMALRKGEDWVNDHAEFLEAQWEMAKEFRMVDPEADLRS